MQGLRAYIFWIGLSLVLSKFSLSQTAPDTSGQSDPDINQCISVVNEVETKGNIVGNLTLDSLGTLPLGIAKKIGATEYIIAIDSAVFMPNKAMFSAYAAIDFPGSKDKVAFRARNIEFNPKGIIGGNNANLYLVSNHRIKIGPKVTLVLKANDNNYVAWNCHGFDRVHLKGYFEFSPEMIKPDTSSAGTGSCVTAAFEIETPDLHQFIAQISVSPFIIAGVKDISFSITQAVVDMSEISNAQGMLFPPGYNFNGNTPVMWQGFYLKELKIKLPKALSQKNGGRKEIVVSNFLIDNSGVSGKFAVNNLLTIGEGDMKGWGFSIDQLGITVLQNHLNGGNIAGSLEIPISEQTQFGYSAIISENPTTKETDFKFTINPKNNIQVEMLSAVIDLYNTSTITITKIGQAFKPEANLNGNISFKSENFKGYNLAFQDFHIICEKPVFVGGIFAVTSATQTGNNIAGNNDNKAAGFKIGINQIAFQFSQTTPPWLYINVGISFMSQNEAGFGATCGLQIFTKFKEEYQANGTLVALNKLKFDKVRINDITLDIQTEPFWLKGFVVFHDNDPVFGKGFMGGIKLSINSVGVFVDIKAAFGSKATYKYFYVDGAVKLPTAIPVCYALGLWGFKGGVYYHMRPINTTPANKDMVNVMANPASVVNIPYVPDSTVAVGFKAGVMFGLMGKDDVLNGDILLELTFNVHGGLDLVRVQGDVALMCSIADKMTKPAEQIPIHGTTDMYYDFVHKVFHMTNTVTFNMYGLSGGGQNLVHIEDSKWYVFVGKPSQRVNVNIYGLASVNSYFMVGTEVEPMPPPPAYVNVAYNNSRNMQSVSAGNGFVAGAGFATDSEGKLGWDFFEIYYYMHAGVGFDVMLGKYKDPWHCNGRTGAPGYRGWYAQGNIWAYVDGGVGVKGDIDIAGIKNKFDFTIASVSFAAILSGKMPNPIYVEGAIHANYNILSVVKGDVDFNFHSGTDCALVQ